MSKIHFKFCWCFVCNQHWLVIVEVFFSELLKAFRWMSVSHVEKISENGSDCDLCEDVTLTSIVNLKYVLKRHGKNFDCSTWVDVFWRLDKIVGILSVTHLDRCKGEPEKCCLTWLHSAVVAMLWNSGEAFNFPFRYQCYVQVSPIHF